MVQGRRPDHHRRRLVGDLRARGLSMTEIAHELGVSRQAISALIRRADLLGQGGVPCTGCQTLIPTAAGRPDDRFDALCLRCLERRPDAAMGQRQRAYRLAAGLSRADVAWLSGIGRAMVLYAEQDKQSLPSDALAPLACLLGLPGAPSSCLLRMPPVVVRCLRVLLAVARAGS